MTLYFWKKPAVNLVDRYCVECGQYLGWTEEFASTDCKNRECRLYRVVQFGVANPEDATKRNAMSELQAIGF